MLDEKLQARLEQFLSNESNRGHAGRGRIADSLVEVRAGLESGRVLAESAVRAHGGSDLVVLEVGSSWGPIAFGAADSPLVSRVVGVDIEDEALELARAIASSGMVTPDAARKAEFVRAAVEKLPFESDTFDLVSCHTVIEHVSDVRAALREMVRVLKPGGVLILAAPNYLWPKEPHLGLWMLPLSPKWILRLQARWTRPESVDFVNHLQFVHPAMLEGMFGQLPVSYRNLYLEKLRRVLVDQALDEVSAYRSWVPALRLMGRLHAARPLFHLVRRLRLYPGVHYSIRKHA